MIDWINGELYTLAASIIILGTVARLGLKDVKPEYSAWTVIGFIAIMAGIFVAVHIVRHQSKLIQHPASMRRLPTNLKR